MLLMLALALDRWAVQVLQAIRNNLVHVLDNDAQAALRIEQPTDVQVEAEALELLLPLAHLFLRWHIPSHHPLLQLLLLGTELIEHPLTIHIELDQLHC